MLEKNNNSMSFNEEYNKYLECSEKLKITILELFQCEISKADKLKLRELFKMKVHHLIIFESLVKNDEMLFAIELLIEFYLGNSIDLDKNCKDHGSDLEIFFDDLVNASGEENLKALFSNKSIPIRNINNFWTLNAIRSALELEEDEIPNWLPLSRSQLVLTKSDLKELMNFIATDNRLKIKEFMINIELHKQDKNLIYETTELKNIFESNYTFLMHVDLKNESGEYLYSKDFLFKKLNKN